MRLSRLLAALAIACALLGALPRIVATMRALSGLRYVADYTVHLAWHVAFVTLFLIAFVWLHLDWKAKTLRTVATAVGALCAFTAPIAGALVWSVAPKFWIAVPTYGLHFLFGIGVFALATSRPGSNALAASTVVATGGFILCFPAELLTTDIGIYAVISFCTFLWVVGMMLPSRERLTWPLKLLLVVIVGYGVATQRATVLGWLCLAALVLTELRALVVPLDDPSEEARRDIGART